MKLDVYTSKGSKSKKSAELNDAVFGIQANRSPFIDNPDWVKKIPEF